MHIIADVGATKTRIAGSGTLEGFSKPVIFNTPLTYEEGLKRIIEDAQRFAGDEHIDGIAIGVPARLTRDKRFILKTSNLLGWENKNMVWDLEQTFHTRVLLENDTALVGLGEAHFGAGRGAEIVVYITISTGVNGVRIVRGCIDHSAFGFEIGYQKLNVDNVAENWQDMISGKAIQETFGKPPRELGKENSIWEDLANVAAQGIHNSILHWSPDRVVIGGSMMNEIGISVDRIRERIHEQLTAFSNPPEIWHSELSDVGGLWGGLALLKG